MAQDNDAALLDWQTNLPSAPAIVPKADFPKHFMLWQDMLITPTVSTLILLAAAFSTNAFAQGQHFGFVDTVLLFFVIQMILAIAVLKALVKAFGFKQGAFSLSNHSWAIYRYHLYGWLSCIHLWLLSDNALIPLPLRKWFYRLQGANFGPGTIVISGVLTQPFELITIEEGAVIGSGALLLPHTTGTMTGESEVLVLGKVIIHKGAIIGAESVLMPGVTVGEGAMVQPMSLVAMNTKIPANEVWGGMPAKRVQ